MITLTVTGTGQAAAKLAQVADDLTGRDMMDGMKQATMLVTGDARRLAPVDTGRLRASILPQVETQGRTVKGVVGSNVSYAAAVELGSAPHWPPPGALAVWARRHGMEEFVVMRSIGTRGTSMMALRTIGTKGWRYLERAFTKNQRQIVDLIGATTSKIVAK